MPLYDVECKQCGKIQEVFLKLSEFENTPECCGEMTSRIISPTQIMADIQPYQSMANGEWITSRSRHRQHLKDHGCIEVGNEPIKQKPFESHTKQEKYELRKQIWQIMDSKGL